MDGMNGSDAAARGNPLVGQEACSSPQLYFQPSGAVDRSWELAPTEHAVRLSVLSRSLQSLLDRVSGGMSSTSSQTRGNWTESGPVMATMVYISICHHSEPQLRED